MEILTDSWGIKKQYMIQIKKSKSGFRVRHLGKNNEVLNTSETLETVQSAYKNIRAVMKIHRSDFVDVTTHTGAIVRVGVSTLEVLAEPQKKK